MSLYFGKTEISNDNTYELAMKTLDALMNLSDGDKKVFDHITDGGRSLELLANLLEDYERQQFSID